MAREQDLPALTRAFAVRVLGGALFLCACATVSPARDVPAVITSPSREGRAELVRVVRQALRTATVTLADDALVRENTLIVERARARGADGAPMTGRDPGRPDHFLLVKNGSRCVLVHQESGRRFRLVAVTCAPS